MSLLISHNLQISLTSNIILVSLTTNKSYHISTNFRRKCKMAQLLLGKNAYSMFLSCWQSWSSNIRELFLSLWFQEISFHSESYLPILDLNHQPLAHLKPFTHSDSWFHSEESSFYKTIQQWPYLNLWAQDITVLLHCATLRLCTQILVPVLYVLPWNN